MKGLIFTLPAAKKRRIEKADIHYYISRYGVYCFLSLFLLVGMIIGAVMARNADKNLLDSLDFIFATNFESRAEQSIMVTFAASMTSCFLFFIGEVLSGLSAWGIIGLPVIILFRGMGVGLCSGYLYGNYGFKGIGFYLLVMLPGVLISTVALLAQGKESINFSRSIWSKLCKKETHLKSSEPVLSKYLINSSYVLIATAIAALVDSLLSTFFSGFFSF